MRPWRVSSFSGAPLAPLPVFQTDPAENSMRRCMLTIVATALLASAGAHAQNAAKPAALDAATVLREVGIAHGMLRGLQYADATTTAQFQATGTQYIVGQAFKPGGPWPAAKLTK